MFQPFHKMQKKIVTEFIKLGKWYLVSQSYKRGVDLFEPEKQPILLSHYDDAGLARIHYDAIPEKDRFRSIIDLQREEHLKKINEMLGPDSKYVVYSSLYAYSLEDMEKHLDTKYKDHTARYIVTKTNWHLGKNKFRTQLEVIFGELYLEIKLHHERLRVKFEDIENS